MSFLLNGVDERVLTTYHANLLQQLSVNESCHPIVFVREKINSKCSVNYCHYIPNDLHAAIVGLDRIAYKNRARRGEPAGEDFVGRRIRPAFY